MSIRDTFEFLNDEIWLKYTQSRYLPLDDIKYRLNSQGCKKDDWDKIKSHTQQLRKLGAVPLFLNSINKKFWYFPADCINRKVHEIESRGNRLWELIKNHQDFKQGLLVNANIEEAITSAIYEGANSTRSQAKALLASGDHPRNKDEWMLLNNYKALQWIKRNHEQAVSLDLILAIHKLVTENTLEGDDANFSGKLRDDKVFVGNHEGVDFTKVEEALDEVINGITNHPRFIHSLIRGILFHYFIAYIHPFFDGNGRTARTLFYFKSLKNKLDFVELLSVSASLKDDGKKYEKSFDLVKKHHLDVTYFIDICLDSLLKALDQVERKVNYLLRIPMLADSLKINQNQISLLQRMALNKHRGVTIAEYAQQIGRSREIARQDLKDLHEKSLLQSRKEGKMFVYYILSKDLKTLVGKI